ncbi:MAG: hypothetical protein ACRDDZ_04845 [Marinifilaceae bacterium]
MKKIVIVLIIGLCVAIGHYETRAQNNSQADTQQVQQVVNKRVRQLNFVLGLTDTQKDSLNQILTRQYIDMQAAQTETGEAKTAAIQAVENQTQNAMQQVLTPSQFRRYCELRARYGGQQNN